MKSSLVRDTIYNYIFYIITGKALTNNFNVKVYKNRNIEEKDIISFLACNLFTRYEKSANYNTTTLPKMDYLNSFFRDYFNVSIEFIYNKINHEDIIKSFFINYRIAMFENRVMEKFDIVIDILLKSTATEIVDDNNLYSETKKNYIDLIKKNNRFAHIYLLDSFLIDDFYVPPIFYCGKNNDEFFSPIKYQFISDKEVFKDELENWKHIFVRDNIIYITGGAGYGKTLFMKMLICKFEQLNFFDSSQYIVIFGDLKNFYINNDDKPLDVLEFLKNCMKSATLMGEKEITDDFVNYYLTRGRCIILLDALDEVDKHKREDLHRKVINYFRSKNPNNKICISSRSRGFLPEEDIEVIKIGPLQPPQIKKYVENITKLGKFDPKDKEPFLAQADNLIKKGFLNSFLVLSLMINIYKAERELPENKLELYQKCFEYIANRREKEKTGERYNWALISTLMKDNTFMELASLCVPNNSQVDKETIKSRLLEVYKQKYVSENQAEQAIEDFLVFCSDRTELFVPASNEDCYKFFHRSFFEYFYAQYLFTRVSAIEDIYKSWCEFDVDSEVFELSLAMFKQKNEKKYQEIIQFLLFKMNAIEIPKEERLTSLNIFILCLQIIDDAKFKDDFADFLINNFKFCISNINEIHNQRYIIETMRLDTKACLSIAEKYREYSLYETFGLIYKVYQLWSHNQKNNQMRDDAFSQKNLLSGIFSQFIYTKFYLYIFFKTFPYSETFETLTTFDIKQIYNKYGNNKAYLKFKKIPHEFISGLKLNLNDDQFLGV